MALQQTLQTATQWEEFFISLGITNEQAGTYADTFVEQRMTEAELTDDRSRTPWPYKGYP